MAQIASEVRPMLNRIEVPAVAVVLTPVHAVTWCDWCGQKDHDPIKPQDDD